MKQTWEARYIIATFEGKTKIKEEEITKEEMDRILLILEREEV